MKCTHVCADQIKPDFPCCLADEIAEPRPDMNIKVVAFTVSEKSINSFWKRRHFGSIFSHQRIFMTEESGSFRISIPQKIYTQ